MNNHFGKYVDYVLKLLIDKRGMYFIDCRNHLYRYFSNEFHEVDKATITLRQIITLGLLESYSTTDSKGIIHENVTITEKGLTLTSEGGYNEWKQIQEIKARKEAEKLDYDLWLAKQSKKWFWVGIITGIVGGILGILSFISRFFN